MLGKIPATTSADSFQSVTNLRRKGERDSVPERDPLTRRQAEVRPGGFSCAMSLPPFDAQGLLFESLRENRAATVGTGTI